MSESASRPNVTLIELEFDTTARSGAPLGDIAASLVSLNDLLRDLGALAADRSSAEFRDIQVVGVEMRDPLTIALSLLAIPEEAVSVFQDICRDIIVFRERRSHADWRLRLPGHITEREVERLQGHVLTLQNAAVPLKRVAVKT